MQNDSLGQQSLDKIAVKSRFLKPAWRISGLDFAQFGAFLLKLLQRNPFKTLFGDHMDMHNLNFKCFSPILMSSNLLQSLNKDWSEF